VDTQYLKVPYQDTQLSLFYFFGADEDGIKTVITEYETGHFFNAKSAIAYLDINYVKELAQSQSFDTLILEKLNDQNYKGIKSEIVLLKELKREVND
jgi:hypothetical protein